MSATMHQNRELAWSATPTTEALQNTVSISFCSRLESLFCKCVPALLCLFLTNVLVPRHREIRQPGSTPYGLTWISRARSLAQPAAAQLSTNLKVFPRNSYVPFCLGMSKPSNIWLIRVSGSALETPGRYMKHAFKEWRWSMLSQ